VREETNSVSAIKTKQPNQAVKNSGCGGGPDGLKFGSGGFKYAITEPMVKIKG